MLLRIIWQKRRQGKAIITLLSRFSHPVVTCPCYHRAMNHPYLAYMLRLWRVGNGEGAAWRASLESPHTGERRAFASPEALFAYLAKVTGLPAHPETAAEDEAVPPGAKEAP